MKRPKPMKVYHVRLSLAEAKFAAKVGQGNLSNGIRKALMVMVERETGR